MLTHFVLHTTLHVLHWNNPNIWQQYCTFVFFIFIPQKVILEPSDPQISLN